MVSALIGSVAPPAVGISNKGINASIVNHHQDILARRELPFPLHMTLLSPRTQADWDTPTSFDPAYIAIGWSQSGMVAWWGSLETTRTLQLAAVVGIFDQAASHAHREHQKGTVPADEGVPSWDAGGVHHCSLCQQRFASATYPSPADGDKSFSQRYLSQLDVRRWK